jgi:hypothetical protein
VAPVAVSLLCPDGTTVLLEAHDILFGYPS